MDRFPDAESAFQYIESFANLERHMSPRSYRLERMRFLLDEFDHPEEGPSFVHVAGSKGKGSTSAFIASILSSAGHSTGLYTSPHVVSYRERITLAGKELPDELYIELVEEIREWVDEFSARNSDPERIPTTFELLTLAGFLAFRKIGCTWAVIETGIGGRLDATNVIRPKASVITPIELEHTDLLGGTIPAIAGEKAGIIKEGVPVVLGTLAPAAEAVMRSKATETGSAVYALHDHLESLSAEPSRSGTDVVIKLKHGVRVKTTLKLIGSVQAENAALAALVTTTLFPEIGTDAIATGLSATTLAGRAELISAPPQSATGGSEQDSRRPPVLLDGAHTVSSAERILATFLKLFPRADGILIFGAVDGKNYHAMASILGTSFSDVIVTTPGYFKASHPEEVHKAMIEHNESSVLVPEPERALDAAIRLSEGSAFERPILVTGSFYLVSEIRKYLVRTGKEVLDGFIS